MNNPPEPAFTEPWHAQLFAITVHLNETGRLPWPRWAEMFSETLRRHGLAKELDGGDDYFSAWLETLEQALGNEGVTSAPELDLMKNRWRDAYLSTPHGQPVRLADG